MPVSEDPDEVEAVVLDTEGHRQRLVSHISVDSVFPACRASPTFSLLLL